MAVLKIKVNVTNINGFSKLDKRQPQSHE